MKIYKVCHQAFFKLGENEHPLQTNFKQDVLVYTSKRRALNSAWRAAIYYRDVLGYRTCEPDRGFIRSWTFESESGRREIDVMEDVTR